MQLQYHLLDVFTNQRFGGNQLAVFPQPPLELPPSTMQQIAREMNLAEVTFVFPPADPRHDFRVRIFSPEQEMPMAGHPTIGTGFLLAQLGMTAGKSTVIFEEGVGPIPVTITRDAAGKPAQVQMRQPLPQFGTVHHDRAGIAALLSLTVDDLQPDVPIQVVSTGLPFLYVPIRSLAAISRIQPRLDLWPAQLKGSTEEIFALTTETQHPASTVHSRMFAPGLGIYEDAATGSASGALGAYLVQHGLAEPGAMVSEQGIEMGRPSVIHIDIRRQDGQFTQVAVGGECVYMGHGTLIIE